MQFSARHAWAENLKLSSRREREVTTSRKWNDIDMLPPKHGDSWSVWKGGRQIDMGFSDVNSLVARWLPANPLLIGAPGRERFLPPVLVEEFEATALKVVRNNCRTMLVALATCGIVLLGVAAARPTSQVFVIGLLVIALGGAIAADYYVGLRSRAELAERALFFRWLKTDSSARFGTLAWLFIGLGVGTLQLLLQWQLGGIDALFHRFGTMYAEVHAGQYWRLLSGPYLHYSIFHFLNNAVLLLFAGTVAFALFGRSVFVGFLSGNVCTALAQMVLGGSDFDNYGGISGGVYTLLGMLIAAGALNRQLFPKGFWLLIVNLTMLGVIASESLSGHAATVAHLSGLLIGGLMGVYYSRRERLN